MIRRCASDNVQLEANTYVIKIKKSTRHRPYLRQPVHGHGSCGNQVNVPGTHTTEPTFGLPVTWVEASLKEEAYQRLHRRGSPTVLSTHLTELLKNNMSICCLTAKCRNC